MYNGMVRCRLHVSFPSLTEFQKMSKWKQMRDEALGVACLNI